MDMGLNNFLNLSNSIKKFENNLKGQKATTDRYLDLLSTFEKDMKEPKEMDFFAIKNIPLIR